MEWTRSSSGRGRNPSHLVSTIPRGGGCTRAHEAKSDCPKGQFLTFAEYLPKQSSGRFPRTLVLTVLGGEV